MRQYPRRSSSVARQNLWINLVMVKQYVSRQWMDEGTRKLRRIGSSKEIGF